ncbi:hypothetical protein [Mumia quercus]|uniref:hypothetical protein n=1 Tax=Mumia quercus TaxID=2976125 RepID=UPI0021CE7FA8|nr:hypothetical protein [Mumia quercus]
MASEQRRRPSVGLVLSGVVTVVSWAAVVTTMLVVMTARGADLDEAARYLAVWVLVSTLPGVLLWRAVAGVSTLSQELGFGAVLGIVAQLVCWAAATAVGAPRLVFLLPVGVAIAFVVSPRLRPLWFPRRRRSRGTPAAWHLAMAAVVALATARVWLLYLRAMPTPPEGGSYTRDLWYNTAISYELRRTILPDDPFAVGEPLRYHWFADAHITSTSGLAGLPIAGVMHGLWMVPALVVLLLASAAATHRFLDGPVLRLRDGAVTSDVRRWWAGPVAAFFVMVAPSAWMFGKLWGQRIGDGFVVTSPSGVLAMIVLVGLVGPVLDVLQGRARWPLWVALLLTLLVGVGTKPSVLPIVVSGALLVVLGDLVGRRRVRWSMLVVVAVSAVLVLVAGRFVIGSTSGSRIRLFAVTALDPLYQQVFGNQTSVYGEQRWIVPALQEGLPWATLVVPALIGLRLLAELPRLLVLVGPLHPVLRQDPGVVWVGGACAGGFAVSWILAHPAYGQHYFWTVALPLATTGVVAGAVRLVPARARVGRLLGPLVVLVVAGASAGWVASQIAPWDFVGTVPERVWDRLRPYALVVGVGVVVVPLVWVAWRKRATSRLSLLTAITVFAYAAVVPGAAVFVDQNQRVPGSPNPVASYYVEGDQLAAATWLREEADLDDVLVTNIFCGPPSAYGPDCPVNSMWIAGATGLRMVLGDWAFAPANLAEDSTVPLTRRPAPWPERLALSRALVEKPTRAVVDELCDDFGARWALVDDRASDVSPQIDDYLRLVHREGHVSVYRLRCTDSDPDRR